MEKVLHVFGNYYLNTCVSSTSPGLYVLGRTKTHSMKDMIGHTVKNP